MDKVIVSDDTIKFNFSLKELVENYRRYMELEVDLDNTPDGPFICCWIAYMCVEDYVPGSVIVNSGVGGQDKLRWDMFDVDETSIQFMYQWIEKVNPDGSSEGNLFGEWNMGTMYSIHEIPQKWFSDGRNRYRLSALELALERNPDVQFDIMMKLNKYLNLQIADNLY